MVTWTTARSDAGADQPQARVVLGTLTPKCPAGPCDITLAPAGAAGTYREPEAPVLDGATKAGEPAEFRWDGAAYVSESPKAKVSCTPKVGAKEIPDGYTESTQTTLTFVPPSGGAPPRLQGQVISTNAGSKASKAKGCTDFVETMALAGSPTGSLDRSAPAPGEYDASMKSAGSTPSSMAPVGSGFWLGPMVVAGTPDAPTITALTSSAAPLSATDGGWAGNAPPAPIGCQDPAGTTTDKGSDGSESFSDVHAVAATKDGASIYVGTWGMRTNPNAVGLKAGCSLTRWGGRLVLVPHGADR